MPEPAAPPRNLVFIDTEYDRLDTSTAVLVEAAYAIEDYPVAGGVPPHLLNSGTEAKALEVNRYHERALNLRELWDPEIISLLAKATEGQTIVGANVRVDAEVLRRVIGHEPWHYRLCDVESVAFLLLGFTQMPGLRDIKNKLTELGYQLPDPDHSAGGDVETLRAVFRTLQRIAEYLLRAGLPLATDLEQYAPEDVDAAAPAA